MTFVICCLTYGGLFCVAGLLVSLIFVLLLLVDLCLLGAVDVAIDFIWVVGLRVVGLLLFACLLSCDYTCLIVLRRK